MGSGRNRQRRNRTAEGYRVIYLSGVIRESMDDIGFLCTPNSETVPAPGRIWAADSGRFAAPERYSDSKYLAWLLRWSPERCLFATAPDVVADHGATLTLSRPMFHRIRSYGYKVAFVAQDGFDGAPWDDFDCLFIGGSTDWKLGSQVPTIVREARERGKWVHMGRVNSYRRMRSAQAIGCQSVDGTFLRFAPDHNEGRLTKWIRRINEQPVFDYFGSDA